MFSYKGKFDLMEGFVRLKQDNGERRIYIEAEDERRQEDKKSKLDRDQLGKMETALGGLESVGRQRVTPTIIEAVGGRLVDGRRLCGVTPITPPQVSNLTSR